MYIDVYMCKRVYVFVCIEIVDKFQFLGKRHEANKLLFILVYLVGTTNTAYSIEGDVKSHKVRILLLIIIHKQLFRQVGKERVTSITILSRKPLEQHNNQIQGKVSCSPFSNDYC